MEIEQRNRLRPFPTKRSLRVALEIAKSVLGAAEFGEEIDPDDAEWIASFLLDHKIAYEN